VTRAAGPSPTRPQPDRLTTPLVRDENGVLVPASWPHALAVAAAGLLAARDADPAAQAAHGVGVLTGGRLTLEDAYAYAKFARVGPGHQRRRHAGPPALGRGGASSCACVAGRDIGVSYADLEQAPAVLLAGFEPEDESPIVFLRLRKAVRRHGLRVFSVAPLASPGLTKLSGTLLTTPARGRGQRADRRWPPGGTTPPRPPPLMGEPSPHTPLGAGARRAGRGDPGRRAARRGARRARRGGHPRGRVGRPDRLGAAPGRRAGRRRGRGAARAAARRPPGDRPGGARRGSQDVGQGLASGRARAGHHRDPRRGG